MGDALSAQETDGDGWLLLRLLALGGWDITVLPAFAGTGVVCTATRGDVGLGPYRGGTVADFATDLYEEALAA